MTDALIVTERDRRAQPLPAPPRAATDHGRYLSTARAAQYRAAQRYSIGRLRPARASAPRWSRRSTPTRGHAAAHSQAGSRPSCTRPQVSSFGATRPRRRRTGTRCSSASSATTSGRCREGRELSRDRSGSPYFPAPCLRRPHLLAALALRVIRPSLALRAPHGRPHLRTPTSNIF